MGTGEQAAVVGGEKVVAANLRKGLFNFVPARKRIRAG
jgi:hypothetical protein